MSQLLLQPIIIATASDGSRISGAKIYSRVSGSTTPTATFSDAALTTQHANPVVADSAGVFPAIYLDPAVNYRFILTDGTDAGNDPDNETEIWLVDNYRTGSELPYDFTIGSGGAVGTSQRYLGPMSVRAFTLPDDFAGSNARLQTAPSAETVFSIERNGVAIGTITFANSSQSGVFVSTGTGVVSIADNDYIDIVAPATTNGAEGLRATFKGTYTV